MAFKRTDWVVNVTNATEDQITRTILELLDKAREKNISVNLFGYVYDVSTNSQSLIFDTLTTQEYNLPTSRIDLSNFKDKVTKQDVLGIFKENFNATDVATSVIKMIDTAPIVQEVKQEVLNYEDLFNKISELIIGNQKFEYLKDVIKPEIGDIVNHDEENKSYVLTLKAGQYIFTNEVELSLKKYVEDKLAEFGYSSLLDFNAPSEDGQVLTYRNSQFIFETPVKEELRIASEINNGLLTSDLFINILKFDKQIRSQ